MSLLVIGKFSSKWPSIQLSSQLSLDCGRTLEKHPHPAICAGNVGKNHGSLQCSNAALWQTLDLLPPELIRK